MLSVPMASPTMPLNVITLEVALLKSMLDSLLSKLIIYSLFLTTKWHFLPLNQA